MLCLVRSTKPLLNFVFINNGTLSNGIRNGPYCRFIDHQVCQVTIIHFGTIHFIISSLQFTVRKIIMKIFHKRKEEVVVVCLQCIEHSNFYRFLNSHLSCVAHFKIGAVLSRNYDHHVPNDA